MTAREVCVDSNVIYVAERSGVQLDVTMNASVVKEIKLVVLNKVARRVMRIIVVCDGSGG